MAWILARPARGRYALSLAMAGVAAATLTACGGDDAQAPTASPSDSSNTSKPAPAPAASKVLLVGVDGATYEQVQGAILRRELPNLAQLNLVPAATGGMPGTVTAQPTLDAPSWATVLTGTWANRHGVTDDTGAVAPQARAYSVISARGPRPARSLAARPVRPSCHRCLRASAMPATSTPWSIARAPIAA